jgi:outer membrane protein assembly factor BamA
VSFFSKSYTQVTDSLDSKSRKDKIKKGWNLGAVPALAFDSDLGFRYGAVANIYNYGDGSVYPRYKHSIYLEWSRTTKGSGQNQIIYDSEYLIPNIRLTAEVNLLTEQALDFYGFNGYEAYYNSAIEDSVSRVYYRHERKITRLKFDFQGKIKDRMLRWYAGFSYLNYNIDSVDIDKLNEGKDEADKLPNTPSLYSKYLKWGLIPEDQKNGGNTNLITCGLVYDTRDNEPNPMKGIWAEAMLISSPSFLGNKFPYTKIALTHRQYFTLRRDILNSAIRLSYQGKIGGTMPFYMLPYVYTPRQPRDGLGGAKTLRGILRNRIVGEDFIFGNVELRWKFFRTIIFNQNIYVAFAPFYDFGMVTGKYKVETSVITQDANDYLAKGTLEKWHSSYGAGLYFAMNQNFIVSFCYGLAANKNDGESGLYIALDFLY